MTKFLEEEAELLRKRLQEKLESYVQYPSVVRSAMPIIDECPDDQELFLRMDKYIPYFDEPIARLAVRAIWKLNQVDSWDNIKTAELHATLLDGIMEREFKNFWIDPITVKAKVSAKQAIRFAKLDAYYRRAILSFADGIFDPVEKDFTPDK